jgi:hypothetical protein
LEPLTVLKYFNIFQQPDSSSAGLADHATDGLSVPNPDAVPAVSDAVSAGGTTGLGNDLLSTGRENVATWMKWG